MDPDILKAGITPLLVQTPQRNTTSRRTSIPENTIRNPLPVTLRQTTRQELTTRRVEPDPVLSRSTRLEKHIHTLDVLDRPTPVLHYGQLEAAPRRLIIQEGIPRDLELIPTAHITRNTHRSITAVYRKTSIEHSLTLIHRNSILETLHIWRRIHRLPNETSRPVRNTCQREDYTG